MSRQVVSMFLFRDLASLEAKYVMANSVFSATQYDHRFSTQVALKAREVLILGQMPS